MSWEQFISTVVGVFVADFLWDAYKWWRAR
jgi:hypothetical protein